MSDPKLKTTSVVIKYRADDGYRSEVAFSSGAGHPDIITREPTDPENALLGALEELARLTALFGFEDRALEVFNAARGRVFDWRRERTPKQEQG